MLPCVILGDSLAVGIGQYRPECHIVAQTGITSGRYVQTLLSDQEAATALISLGVKTAWRKLSIWRAAAAGHGTIRARKR